VPTTPPPNPAGSPDDRSLSIDTVVVRSGRPPAEPGQPLNQPIVPASAFHGGGSIEYAREEAPTTTALEEALGALEHGTAIAFSSGMGAANAVMDLVPPGGVVVAPSAAYTGVAARLRELDTMTGSPEDRGGRRHRSRPGGMSGGEPAVAGVADESHTAGGRPAGLH
jgi:hypothetical protein